MYDIRHSLRRFVPGFSQSCQILLVATLAFGCAGRRVDMDTADSKDNAHPAAAQKDPRDMQIDTLTSALSRAQSRIEELDAKVSALSDKVDSTRLAVDNIAGQKPLKSEAVGSARTSDDQDADEEPVKHPAEKKVAHLSAAERKNLLDQEGAVTDFNKSMGLFKTGRYADAELSFNHFTEQYPEHILAGSAQFYSGESYLMMGEYKLALAEYQKVISSFGSSPRVASAMVRISHCYAAAGNANESSRIMSLARDLFEGNPSLEWPAPAAKAAKSKAKLEAVTEAKMEQKTEAHADSGLNAGPIEPAQHPKEDKDGE